MENIRTNKAARVAALILVLVLVTMCILGGTLAKYITKDSGSDSARVAKFGVVATMSGNLFGQAYSHDAATTDKSAIVAYSTDNANCTIKTSQSGSKILAPGAFNDKGMTISIKGQPEVATAVTFEAPKDASNKAYVDSDIALNAGSYGVMTKVDRSAIDKDNDYTVNKYYKLAADNESFVEAIGTEDATVSFYKLKDTATVDTNPYMPVTWTVTKNGTSEQVTSIAALKAKVAVLAGEHDPNYDYDKSTSIASGLNTMKLTWAWDFDASTAGTNDAKDTILGDMIAKAVDATDDSFYVVSGSDFKVVHYASVVATASCPSDNKVMVAYTGATAPTDATESNVVATLTVALNGQLTVKQISTRTATT